MGGTASLEVDGRVIEAGQKAETWTVDVYGGGGVRSRFIMLIGIAKGGEEGLEREGSR